MSVLDLCRLTLPQCMLGSVSRGVGFGRFGSHFGRRRRLSDTPRVRSVTCHDNAIRRCRGARGLSAQRVHQTPGRRTRNLDAGASPPRSAPGGWRSVSPTVLRLRGSAVDVASRPLLAAVLAGGGCGGGVPPQRLLVSTVSMDSRAPPTVELSVDRAHRWQWARRRVAHHVNALEPCDLVTIDGIQTTRPGTDTRRSRLGRARSADASVERSRVPVGANVNLGWLRETSERLHRPGQSWYRGYCCGTSTRSRSKARSRRAGSRNSWHGASTIRRCHRSSCSTRSATLRAGSSPGSTSPFPSVKLGLEAHSREFHFGPQQSEHDEAPRPPRRGVRLGAPVSRLVRDPATGSGRQADRRGRHRSARWSFALRDRGRPTRSAEM